MKGQQRKATVPDVKPTKSPLSHIPLQLPFQHAFITERGKITPCILIPVTTHEEAGDQKCILQYFFCVDSGDELAVFNGNPSDREQDILIEAFKQENIHYSSLYRQVIMPILKDAFSHLQRLPS